MSTSRESASGSKLKNNRSYCESPFVLEPIGRCRMHRGKNPVGVANPAKMHGLTHEAVLIESRIADLVPRVDIDESGRQWNRQRRLNNQMLVARAAKDFATVSEKLTQMTDLINRGARDHELWAKSKSTAHGCISIGH